MSNASDHVPITRDPSDEIFVRKPDDLGPEVMAPDGVMRRRIEVDVAYTFQKEMSLPRLWVQPTADPTIAITLRGARAVKLLCDGSDIPHIWGRDIGIITLDLLQFVDVSNGGAGHGTRLFDLVGVSAFSFFVIRASTWLNFKFMGTLTDVSWIQNGPTEIFRALAGYVIRSSPGVNNNTIMTATRIENLAADPDMVGPALTFIGGPPSVILIGMFLLQGKPANSFIHIDSGSTGAFNISSNHYRTGVGFGSFFRPDESLTLTAQADVSIAIASFTDSATAPGVDTSVTFASGVDVKRGDVILISGELAYDGTHTVVRVASDLMSFDIAVVHSTSGAGQMDITEHTVSGLVRFVEGESVTVSATTNYNAVGIQVIRKTSDTTFTLPQAFLGDDAAGLATSSGKDQTGANVFVSINAEQESSTVLGEACWNGNVSSTAITDGAYVPLVLTGAMLAPGAERVSLDDASSGRLRYDGEAPVRLSIAISLFGEKGGASPDNYRIAITKNGAVLAFVSTPYAPLELRDTNKQVIYTPTIQLDPADEVQAMIAGDGSTAAVTFTDGQIIVRI